MPFGFGADGEPGAWGEEDADGGDTPPPPVEGGIPLGALVQVDGLVAAAQHNGKLGVVRGYDEDSGRYVVQVAAPLNETCYLAADICDHLVKGLIRWSRYKAATL